MHIDWQPQFVGKLDLLLEDTSLHLLQVIF
jgi:hypothetical protein